jgi:tetratricopeptide (TPR) repeat protein
MTEESLQLTTFNCSGPEAHAWPNADDAAKCCNGFQRAHRIRPTDGNNARIEFYWEPIPDTTGQVAAAPGSQGTSTPLNAQVLDGVRPTPRNEHLAFFQRLSEFTDFTDPRWHELVAGLVTLRLVDRWVVREATERDITAREHLEVRRAIAAVRDVRVRNVLVQLLQATRETEADAASLSVLLLSYAGLLEQSAEWRAAIDVYQTSRRHSLDADRSGLPLIYGRIGFCHRQLGELAAAGSAYEDGRRLAEELGLSSAALNLRNCEGVLALHRGNIPEAARILDGVIEQAASADHRQVFASASHDRGAVAIKQGEYTVAAIYFDKALRGYDDHVRKERALEDLADALYLLGAHDSARDAFLINSVAAVQADVRAHAVICLMRLAIDQGDELMFETYRNSALDLESLSSHMQAQLHRQLAIGYAAFDRQSKARDHYRALLFIAKQNRLNEYVFDAEAGLSGRSQGPSCVVSIPLPLSLESIGARLRAAREALAAPGR